MPASERTHVASLIFCPRCSASDMGVSSLPTKRPDVKSKLAPQIIMLDV